MTKICKFTLKVICKKEDLKQIEKEFDDWYQDSTYALGSMITGKKKASQEEQDRYLRQFPQNTEEGD